MTLPCNNCPWRKDAPTNHWWRGHFRRIWKQCQDDGMAIMLCHKASNAAEAKRKNMPCRGWILSLGFDAIGVRLLVIQGILTLRDLVKPRGCPHLFASFADMLKANGVKPPSRNTVLREEEHGVRRSQRTPKAQSRKARVRD